MNSDNVVTEQYAIIDAFPFEIINIGDCKNGYSRIVAPALIMIPSATADSVDDVEEMMQGILLYFPECEEEYAVSGQQIICYSTRAARHLVPWGWCLEDNLHKIATYVNVADEKLFEFNFHYVADKAA